MPETNPFASAKSEALPGASESALYTARVYLAQTRPWLLLLGLIGLLGAALMLLLGAGMALLGLTGGGSDAPMGTMGSILGMVYMMIGLFYAIPAVMMIQQGVAISAVTNGGGLDEINEVLRHGRNFWRLMGGFTLLVMVMYCGGIGVLTMVGMGAASAGL